MRHATSSILFALATLILAGCGTSAGSTRAVTLRVLNWAPELELALEQRIAGLFEARHPGVEVVVESVVNNFGEKLIASIASGTPPDVFLLDVPDIPAFVDRGLVLDLAPYAARVGYDREDVFPQVLEVFERGRRLYAFPKDFTPMVVYYNRQVFARRGVAEPPPAGWTRDEFLAAARALAADEDGDGQIDLYAIDLPRELYQWVSWVWSGGGDILDPRGLSAEGFLDSPATVETFTFLTDLVLRWKVSPPVQFVLGGDPSRAGRFYTGRQAMFVSGHWSLPLLAKYATRGAIDLGVAPIPHVAGVEPVTAIYVSGWAVPANVRHKRLAVELAAFLSGPDAQRERAASRLGISAMRSVALDHARRDASGVEDAFLRIVERGRMPWGAVVRDFHRVERLSVDIMDRRLLRGEDLQRAATAVARAIDEATIR